MRNISVGMVVAAAGLACGGPRAFAAVRGPVVGFGDSVAAGYGLSVRAEWPPFWGVSYVGSRFARGARCRVTPRAYPCVVAAKLGSRATSRDYAIQNATTNDVLQTELPTMGVAGVPQMSARARSAVRAVTLTIGANDFAFDQCIQAELQATLPDPCLSGTLNNLSLSSSWQAKINQIQTNLPKVIKALGRAFPHATVYVTTYYGFVPGPVAANQQPCTMYGLPALEFLLNNLHPDTSLAAQAAVVVGYLNQLPSYMAQFQARLATVSSFLQGQLNAAIREGVRRAVAYPLDASQATPTPVAIVSLDNAFKGHDVCSRRPWVYNFRIQFKVNGNTYNSGAVCPFPMPQVGNPPSSTEFGDGFSWSGGVGPASVSFSASYTTNCIAHPTPAGQRQIALAVSRAANGPVYCPPPPGQTGEGVSGIRTQGTSCGYARGFVRTSRLCSIPSPTGRAQCTDRGWTCRVGQGVRLGDGIGGIPAVCRRGRQFMSWHAGY
jgi:hypothetical protein